MKSIRNLKVEEVGVLNATRNRFFGRSGDFVFKVLQPRRRDSSSHRRAWKDLSDYTLGRYKRLQYVDSEIYNSKWRCKQPLYRGEVPGFIPLIMVIDDRIVGFADQMYKYGDKFLYHKVAPDEVGCSMNLCVVDQFQGMGIGRFYAEISVFIAKHFGATWALGFTPRKRGMFGIRMKEGWEHVATIGKNVVIRKRLIPRSSR